MAVRDITTLKSYFETGDVPTQAQFADLIDTMFANPADAVDVVAPADWAPVVADAPTGGNVATGTFSGSWQRVGAMIHLTVRLIDINTTGMTGGNALYVRGLPANVRAGSLNVATAPVRLENVTFSGQVVAFASNGNSYVTFYQNVSEGSSTLITVAALASGTADFRFSISYPAEDL